MANTSLTRTMGTPTSRKQFTISVWLKRSAISLSNAQHIWNGYYSADNRLVIYFQNGANDALGFYNVAGGSATANIQTNRQFRDINGWFYKGFVRQYYMLNNYFLIINLEYQYSIKPYKTNQVTCY